MMVRIWSNVRRRAFACAAGYANFIVDATGAKHAVAALLHTLIA